MFERRRQPLLGRAAFLRRLSISFFLASVMIFGALFAGMLGYRELEGMSWLDAFVNASMILGGMGPVETLKTDAGKLFAGTYALFSGLLFLVLVGIILAPVAHRILHHFHLENDSGDEGASDEME